MEAQAQANDVAAPMNHSRKAMDHPAARYAILLVCWAIGSTVLGRSFTVLAPDPTDAQLFAYFGQRWLEGQIPYVDIWDHKPPAIFAMNALAFLISPHGFAALAWLEGLFILGCIATVFLLMRRWGAPWLVACLATTSVAIAANLLYYNERGNLTEIYMLWPVALSMLFFSKAGPDFRWQWLLLAGVCSGIASLFKPTGLSSLLAQGAFVFLSWAVFRRLTWRQMLLFGALGLLGVLIAWFPAALYYAWHGALDELIYASWTYNVFYGLESQSSPAHIVAQAVARLSPIGSLVVGGLFGALLYAGRCAGSRQGQGLSGPGDQTPCFWWPLALLWVVFDLAGALAGGRNYAHYFLPLTVSLSVLAALACWFLIDAAGERRPWGMNKALFALIVGPLVFPQLLDAWELKTGDRPRIKSWEAVVDRLNAIRGPADTLFTWDYMPLIYVATDMKTPIRLMDAHNIFDSSEAHRKFGGKIMEGLRRTAPTFVVDGWDNARRERLGSSDPIYKDFRDFLATRYVLVYDVDNLKVYKSRPNVDP
jgi:hypothetical protein